MRVTQVTYTRVRSDHVYGNHQAGVVAQVDESDDPAQVLACARELACQAVGEGLPTGAAELAGRWHANYMYVQGDPDDEEDRDGEPADEDLEGEDQEVDEPEDPSGAGG